MGYKEIQDDVNKNEKAAIDQIEQVKNDNDLMNFKASFLGKKSLLLSLYSKIKEAHENEKKDIGSLITNLKNKLNELYEKKEKELFNKKIELSLIKDKIDITLPGFNNFLGSKHPFYAVIDDITSYLLGLGFAITNGPEVETEENNFEKVNIPIGHPSRDMQDSFTIGPNVVLRSHTSSVQARVMTSAKGKGPIKIICPGKVYRRDNDATHSHQFGQIEGLVISEDVTFASLLETLTLLVRHLFGEKKEVRFRPSYFPFTEPSVEVDCECFECNGKGCSFCKNTGFIEILGSGMVHPNVLRLNGFDDKVYKGFAFGLGVDRIAMLKYGIDDIKRLYQNDINFLKQFSKE